MPSPDTAQVQPAARLHAAEIPHHRAEMGQVQGGLQLPSCLGLAAQGLQHPHSDRTAQKPQRLAAPIAEGRLLGFQPKIQTLLPGFRYAGEHCLTEGMAVFVPIYRLLHKIPAIRDLSNRIVVLERG